MVSLQRAREKTSRYKYRLVDAARSVVRIRSMCKHDKPLRDQHDSLDAQPNHINKPQGAQALEMCTLREHVKGAAWNDTVAPLPLSMQMVQDL